MFESSIVINLYIAMFYEIMKKLPINKYAYNLKKMLSKTGRSRAGELVVAIKFNY